MANREVRKQCPQWRNTGRYECNVHDDEYHRQNWVVLPPNNLWRSLRRHDMGLHHRKSSTLHGSVRACYSWSPPGKTTRIKQSLESNLTSDACSYCHTFPDVEWCSMETLEKLWGEQSVYCCSPALYQNEVEGIDMSECQSHGGSNEELSHGSSVFWWCCQSLLDIIPATQTAIGKGYSKRAFYGVEIK